MKIVAEYEYKNPKEIREGIIVSKIAAHAKDIDDEMADARRIFVWEKQWECSIDPVAAKKIRDDRKPEIKESCSM